KLDLEFPGTIAVLAGVNGSGKSTILEALATLLGRIGGALHEGARDRRPLQAGVVRNGAKEALLMINTSGFPDATDRIDWGLRVERTLNQVSRRFQAHALTARMTK